MGAASPFDAELRDIVGRLHAAATLLGDGSDQGEVARRAVTAALALTRSTECVLALGSLRGYEHFYSHALETSAALPDDAVTELLVAAGYLPVGVRPSGGSGGPRQRPSTIGVELKASGQSVGALVVARPSAYSDTEKQLLEIFGVHVERALDAAGIRQRQQGLESALTGLREKVDELSAQESAAADALATAGRVERAHELAVEVLSAVSSLASAGTSLTDFYRRLARTVGELVGAEKVLFWRLRDDGTLAPLAGGYGLSEAFLARLGPTRSEPTGSDLSSRVVFKDLIFRANQADDPSEFSYVLERLGVQSAISVPWRAGSDRLGLLAAYDSTRPTGFSREDTWVLQKAGLAAGLVTELWHAQEDLRRSVERMTKVDAARQLLLRNMTTVVEKERRRFVTELHDDALQKLTAAELHAARLAPGRPVDAEAHEALLRLLDDTESALRRLVFEVHPPSLDEPDGLARSIKERAAMLNGSGITSEMDLKLPETLSHDTRALIFRQVAEALGNVERHSKATHVAISLDFVEGGVLGVVSDNGRGFVVAEKSHLPGHLGLQALKERALMAGGRYKIDSSPGSGTRIEFWIPIEQ